MCSIVSFALRTAKAEGPVKITSPESGTKYVSSDESVFVVDYSNGQIGVRPVNIGDAYLTITHSSFSKQLKIKVEKQN
jgi:hypothetical protein